MKENENNDTALHFVAYNGYEDMVNLLLNTFSAEEEKDKLIEYVMKENDDKCTALHYASVNGHEEIVKLLLHYGCHSKRKKQIN
jgi:ankyrin repeat protein